MKFAVSEMAFSPPLSTPMTLERWMQLNQRMDGCLEVRNIQWLYSLVSVQGDRSMCLYQIPYTEAIREAYREAGLNFQRIWQGEGVPSVPTPAPDNVVVIVEIEPTALEELSLHDLSTSDRSVVILTSPSRTVLLLTAPTMAIIETDLANIKIPIQGIWQATLIQP